MTEYQAHAALVATLETEIVRLRAVNAELRKSIQAPVQPDTKLEQAARQALGALEAAVSDDQPYIAQSKEAVNALREALEAQEPWTPDDMAYRPGGLSQSAAVEQEPVTWIANEWSVFNTGAEVASGLSLNEAMDYLTDERAAREWSVVCVINKDNMPTRAAPQPARQPLTDDWIRGMCKESWVFDAAKQWIRIAERAHGIGGEA